MKNLIHVCSMSEAQETVKRTAGAWRPTDAEEEKPVRIVYIQERLEGI